MEIYDLVAGTNSFGVEVVLLGFLMLLAGLFYQSEVFERLVGSRIKGPLYLAYGTFLPSMLVLMEIQKSRRGGGGILKFLGGLIIVVIVVVIGVLALIAFLIYRFLRRRR